MTIDVVRVRTDRVRRDGRDEGFLPNRDATMDVSDLPAGKVEAYVDRAVGDGYGEYYLERKGTKTTLTAVREPSTTRSGDASNSPARSESDGRTPRETDRPAPEWTYAVLATESTPQ